MNNLIPTPGAYVDRKTTRPDYDQWCNQTPVPIVTDANWTLSNFTIATGFLTAVAIAQDSTAVLAVPGLMAGHQHKVTIVTAATDQDIEVYLGGVLVGTITAAGTDVFYGKCGRANELKFTNPDVGALTASITSVVVEGRDPWNGNLFPAQA